MSNPLSPMRPPRLVLPSRKSKTSCPGPWFRTVAGLLVVAGISLAGCSMVDTGQPLAQPPAPGTPSYKVIFAGSSGQPAVFTGSVDKPLTVQQALEESGATQKYKGMLVDLARKTEKNGEVLKLPVTFDNETGSVLEEQNYAVHAGDEILIRPNNPGPLESLFRSIPGNAIERR